MAHIPTRKSRIGEHQLTCFLFQATRTQLVHNLYTLHVPLWEVKFVQCQQEMQIAQAHKQTIQCVP